MTGVPSNASVPTAGRVTIFTLASVSPVSVSTKPKSSASKVYGLSTTVVTVLWAAVGALLVVATWKTGERATMLCEPEGAPLWTVMLPD